jgi:outer membrane protein
MKKFAYLLVLSLLLFCEKNVFAQRIGYIDMDSVLSRLDEYKQADKDIEALAKNWQNEIAAKRKEIAEEKFKFEAEKLILPEKIRREREEQIERKEKALIEQQTKLFGYQGELFRRRQELVRPIQEKVFKAAQIVAKKHKLNIILDRSRDLHFAYVDPTYDFTEYVLEELGIIDRDLVIER